MAGQADLTPLIQRIRQAIEDANRDRLRPMPALCLEPVGSWAIPGEGAALIERFMALQTAGAGAHA